VGDVGKVLVLVFREGDLEEEGLELSKVFGGEKDFVGFGDLFEEGWVDEGEETEAVAGVDVVVFGSIDYFEFDRMVDGNVVLGEDGSECLEGVVASRRTVVRKVLLGCFEESVEFHNDAGRVDVGLGEVLGFELKVFEVGLLFGIEVGDWVGVGGFAGEDRVPSVDCGGKVGFGFGNRYGGWGRSGSRDRRGSWGRSGSWGISRGGGVIVGKGSLEKGKEGQSLFDGGGEFGVVGVGGYGGCWIGGGGCLGVSGCGGGVGVDRRAGRIFVVIELVERRRRVGGEGNGVLLGLVGGVGGVGGVVGGGRHGGRRWKWI
jgi:hypothetical protein